MKYTYLFLVQLTASVLLPSKSSSSGKFTFSILTPGVFQCRMIGVFLKTEPLHSMLRKHNITCYNFTIIARLFCIFCIAVFFLFCFLSSCLAFSFLCQYLVK